MTKEELAAALDKIAYGEDIDKKLVRQAKEAGLVIMYGISDDLVELEGAINDEMGCYGGGDLLLTRDGFVGERDGEETDEELEEYLKAKKIAKHIEALRGGNDEAAWHFETEIPHATFTIMDGSYVQCRGLVFSIDDL